MSATLTSGLGIVALVVLIFAGMNIGLSMLIVGFVGVVAVSGLDPAVGVLKTAPFTTAATYSLAVIPLFVFMGELAFASGMSSGLYNAGRKWLARLPGGLCCGTLAACAGFAAICGSTAATAATVGTVALPEMKASGYKDSLATGSLAAGGTLGILIPPSTGFIVYGIISETSIGRLFAAGIIPGLMLALLMIATVIVSVKISPELAPASPATTWKEKLASIPGLMPVLVLFAFVIGGMFSGLFTATEAAGAGAFVCLLYLLARLRFTWKGFETILRNTIKTTAMIFLIVIGATVFGYFLTMTQLPASLAGAVMDSGLNKYVVVALVILMYILLGAIMDALAMLMLTVPIFLPVVVALGFDPVWFGVVVVLACEVGLITPPVGLNVYVIGGIAKGVPLPTIFRGALRFVIPLLVMVVILASAPIISLWLPNLLYGVE